MNKILIVEDEKFLAKIYKHKLVCSKFEVISVGSAEEALAILAKEKPDLILLDILLPGMSGVDFLREKAKVPKFDIIPVLAFSNYDDSKIKKIAKDLGASDYLIKADHTPQEIVDKINQIIAAMPKDV